MTTDKNDIRAWLNSLRPWQEGVSLYARHGVNRMFKEMFRLRGDTVQTRAILVEELRKLAGVSEAAMRQMVRTARPAASATQPVGTVRATPSTAPAVVTKMVRFRERFPFLNDEQCPDVLKILVADLFTAYGRYKDAHARLSAMPDDEATTETEREAATVVENFIENKAIWAELDYYREHGTLLGNHPKVKEAMSVAGYARLTDMEVQRALANARSNLSKARRKVASYEAAANEPRLADARLLVEKWNTEKTALEQEVERRKKN